VGDRDRLITYNSHHLPVVDDEGVVGLLSTTDITAYVSNADMPEM
jgi:CBS domain-containing protein